MHKKHQITAAHLLAGGAALTTVAVILAPIMLRAGYQKLRSFAEQFELDMETGTLRRKDQGVVILEKSDYKMTER